MPTTDNGSFSAFAPGRVNVIGEHTDYNDGLALPFAIAAGVQVHTRHASVPGLCRVLAADLGESDCFSAVDPEPAPGWRAFARGAVAELVAAGIPLREADIHITGDLPRGAGLSSSAALEVALCLGLVALAGTTPPEPLELAQLCSRIEHTWLGTESGLMDQLASLYGEPGHALLIDFATRQLEPVALHLGDAQFVAMASGEAHVNSASGYNTRRRECREAAAMLGLESLRDATLEGAASLPDPLNRRVRHLVEENARVLDTVAALRAGDVAQVGELLNASHVSLRDLYEVSTPAVEATVARLLDAGALGARIVGGGFGGSVLGLIPPDAAVPDGALVLHPGPGARLTDAPWPT